MSRRLVFIVVNVLVATTLACSALGGGGGGTAPAVTTGPGGAEATPGAGGSTGSETRSANISEIRNTVEARESDSADWQTADTGEQIAEGGGVRTGDESRARLDISPDKTVLRIAPNTEFKLEALSPEPTDPVTKFVLDAGKLFVRVTKALGGGSFEVETPTGVATVRGSLMSAAYSRDDGRLIVTCLEGECRLGDAARTAFTDLTEGEASEIPGAGMTPLGARLMTEAELDDWLLNFPELSVLIERIRRRIREEATPTPTGGGGGLTACDHPYFPVRPGATWTYSTEGGPMTWTVTGVSGDTTSASADMTADFSGQVTSNWHWQCDAGGLVSYEFGNLFGASVGQIASYQLISSSGTFLPPADLLAPGYSWSNVYELEMTITVPGAPEGMSGTIASSVQYTVTGAEPVTVGDQTYDGLQVSQSGTFTMEFQVPGAPTQPTTVEFSGTIVFAKGVGIVRTTSESGNTELTSFSIP
ncbi:MAG: FecR protein [Anaerolineales bacterium]|nr:FecR protein [Anaerolineales bacterium]